MTLPAAQVAAELTDELTVIRLDLKEMLATAVSTLSRMRPGTWVALVTNTDPSTSGVVVADLNSPAIASYVDLYMASLHSRGTVPTAGISRTVIESGEPLLVPEVPLQGMFNLVSQAARDWFDRHPLPIDVHAMSTAVVPMRAMGQVVGTLQLIEWNPNQPLTEADVSWLQVVADRLGWMIEHAQCHDTGIMRLDRLTAIRNVSLALASSQDLRLTLHLILEQIIAKLRVEAADLLEVDAGSKELYAVASAGFHAGWIGDIRLPITPRLANAATPAGRFELGSDPDWLGAGRRRSVFAREGFADYRGVPLTARGRLLGVIEVFSRSKLSIDEEWTGFLHAMAVTAAVAIDNANLRQQVERGPLPVHAAIQRPELSSLEWRVMGMVVEGSTNREIAAAVHLSENTIKFHIRRLLDRIGAVNRTELARKATQNSWL